MANNFRKLALFSALAGVAAAGTYYFLQKNNTTSQLDADEIDDFDDFDENLDDEDDFAPKQKRAYVSIDLDSAKEIVSENVIKALDKTKELITDFNVPEKLDKAKEFVEELASAKDVKAEPPVYTTVFEKNEDSNVDEAISDETTSDKDIENDFDEESEDFEFTEDTNS